MAIMYDWVCSKGHVFEDLASSDCYDIPCPYCGNATEPDYGIYSKQSIEIAMSKAVQLQQSILDGEVYCEGIAYRILLATPSWHKRSSTTLGIVVHRDEHGNYRHPGHPNAPVPPGFERIEVSDVHHARKIEKEIERANEEVEANKLAAERGYALAQLKSADEDTKSKWGDMSQQGRVFAEYAMQKAHKRLEEKSTRPQGGGVGFEALAYDKTNRQEHRDANTDWKKKQE